MVPQPILTLGSSADGILVRHHVWQPSRMANAIKSPWALVPSLSEAYPPLNTAFPRFQVAGQSP